MKKKKKKKKIFHDIEIKKYFNYMYLNFFIMKIIIYNDNFKIIITEKNFFKICMNVIYLILNEKIISCNFLFVTL